jgi:hypothetical protein
MTWRKTDIGWMSARSDGIPADPLLAIIDDGAPDAVSPAELSAPVLDLFLSPGGPSSDRNAPSNEVDDAL